MGKEIQRESLLIAGGCSFGDSTYSGYLKHNVTPWPELAGKELGIETLNLCKSGYSNDNITNSVMDAVIDNLDKKLIVMILWTSPNRINFFDYSTHVAGKHLQLNNDHEIVENFLDLYGFWGSDFDKVAVNYNLRCMWKLNEFLKNNNIEFYQAQSSSLITNLVWMGPDEGEEYEQYRYSKLIAETPHNRYYNPYFFTTQSFRSNMKWMKDKTCHLSDEDSHPNEKGHQYILESFLVMKESGVKEISSDVVYDDVETEFIYD